ncbi:hypothetical protein UY3_14664 [Chelonia mydas]|uniref:Uncharacterized protein n=1 Tax=Chelonia mydas TaxID=8469 RepID=M7B7Q0_CHEMY|nr:hypothetical protein UY3_14664 [Chelonia mydas]
MGLTFCAFLPRSKLIPVTSASGRAPCRSSAAAVVGSAAVVSHGKKTLRCGKKIHHRDKMNLHYYGKKTHRCGKRILRSHGKRIHCCGSGLVCGSGLSPGGSTSFCSLGNPERKRQPSLSACEDKRNHYGKPASFQHGI